MKKYSVQPYQHSHCEVWNTFIRQAKNGTFMFHRDFMDYHKDRFDDSSLLIFEDQKLVGVLPANKAGQTVFSHQGLTYGGLVYHDTAKSTTVISVFRAVLQFLNENEITSLYIKTIPAIYHTKPADEFLYALFLAQAQLVRRDFLSVIDLSKGHVFSENRKRGLQRGIKNQLVIKEESDFKAFWNSILIPNLQDRHQTKPIHSVEEIQYLKQQFPAAIRQFNVYFEGQIVAGTTVFETETVAHCQYISKFENGKNLGSLDFLYHYLITNVFASKRFFDFGISTEEQGRLLNDGLCHWKESFGASAIIHDFYEIDSANYRLLDSYFVPSKNSMLK